MGKTKRSKGKGEELAGQADAKAPLDSAALLAASKPLLARLEADLLVRVKESEAVTSALSARYEQEKAANRTAESFAGWTAMLATQVAAAWLLSCVFVRTLEDRGLLRQARLAGVGAEDSQKQFFTLAPSLTERDYLLMVFRELAHHPATKDLFDPEHSLVWKLSPSAELAKELLALFRSPTASEPSFRFGQASTRFLGDLYQDLSEEVRKRYALLQTPDFVEEFILDRTLEPAITRFGLDDTTLIDPTCGSGHFLLGAFDRLFEHRLRAEPGIDARAAAVEALTAVYGADINPYAVAIARFRLTLSFLAKAGYSKLADAPAIPLHLVVADSLRINAQHQQPELWHQDGVSSAEWLGDVFSLEDERAAKDVLFRRYAAVVGNPPYITVKDSVVRDVYRNMYVSAAGKYALSAPFCERFFQLARPRGYAGQITANSFMKREFGKRLIEEFLPTVNLELIANTSGAYIPGHGTPTVLLFGTNENLQGNDVLAVLAKRGEPSTPTDPRQGHVWRSIAAHFDEVGFENEFVSIARVPRDSLAKHPWSLGGGGASELKVLLEERGTKRLGVMADSIGIASFTLEDDVFLRPADAWNRLGVPKDRLRPMVIGEAIRDWSIEQGPVAFFPYDHDLKIVIPETPELRLLWPYRTGLANNKLFGGKTKVEGGLAWYEYGRFSADKLRTPLTISFAFVATHNHFVLDRGGKVFNRSAPIIKLPTDATEDDHLGLLAYLNSSTAAFYFRQAGHSKGAQGVNEGHKSEQWEQFLEYSAALLSSVPVPPNVSELAGLGRRADAIAREMMECRPSAVAAKCDDSALLATKLREAEARSRDLLHRLCSTQEAIDWRTYRLFGLITDEPDLPDSIEPGSRDFEHKLIRSMPTTAWFSRNNYRAPTGSSPTSNFAADSGEISLLEQPEFKHRWTIADSAAQVALVIKDKQLKIVEDNLGVLSAPSSLSDALRLIAGGVDQGVFDRGLLDEQSIPFLSAMRFSESGLTKYAEWLCCWDSQRREDTDGQPTTSSAPRYLSVDYSATHFWQLRGKLDVPNERFISYPDCESDNDGEPVYGWAGWDHLQRAQALASLYLKRKDTESWTPDRLTPMLAGLLELIPWIKQWHNEPSQEFGGLKMGDYYEQFLDGECRQHGLTHQNLLAWRPVKSRAKQKVIAKNAIGTGNARVVKKRLNALERNLRSAKHEPTEPTEAE